MSLAKEYEGQVAVPATGTRRKESEMSTTLLTATIPATQAQIVPENDAFDDELSR